MTYGLKDEEFDKIQNKIAKKLYEIPNLDRPAFLVECTEQELRNRGNKNKKTKFFPSDLAEKRFAREWTKACGRIRRENKKC